MATVNGQVKPSSEQNIDRSAVEHQVIESETLPSDDELKKVHGLKLLDAKGKSLNFEDLVKQTATKKTLVVFIRHFFCGVSTTTWRPFSKCSTACTYVLRGVSFYSID